jgi:CheY-like chemotaxis protein
VEDCDAFQHETNNMADLVLTKPISAEMITQQIKVYMAELERQREELRQMQEEMERRAEATRRKHILVIDDDPLMLKIIKEYLHDDYDVATANSGRLAYKFLETKKTDLILLDYEMPGENGPQVLENLRNNYDISKVPVLFLTGTTEREKIAQALMLRPQGYLLKPIDKDKLLGNIEKFLGNNTYA